MSTKTLIATALVALSAATVPVFAASQTTPDNNGPKTRAEVLADLKIYQESGLADAERDDESGLNTVEHERAQARYNALKASPRFAQLVQQYGGKAAKGAAR